MYNLKYSSLFLLFLLGSFFLTNSSLAWEGIDQERNTIIEIPSGNLVREGLVIEFYDNEELHLGRVITMNTIAGGTELVVEDFNEDNQERTLIMNE